MQYTSSRLPPVFPLCAGDCVWAGAFPGQVSGVHLRVLQHPWARPGQHPLHPSGEWSVSHPACTPASPCGQLTDCVFPWSGGTTIMRQEVVSRLPLRLVTSEVTLSYMHWASSMSSGGGGCLVFATASFIFDELLKKGFLLWSLEDLTGPF